MGLAHDYGKHSGRGSRPRPKMAKVAVPSSTKTPKVSERATWHNSVPISIKDCAQIDYPLGRLRATDVLDKLLRNCCKQSVSVAGIFSEE